MLHALLWLIKLALYKLSLTLIVYIYSVLVYTNLGLGFASGCIIVVAEIIYAKLTRPRNIKSRCCTILLLLIFSAVLTAVTVTMIQSFYYPMYYIIQEVLYHSPTETYQGKTGEEASTGFHSLFKIGWCGHSVYGHK